MKKRILRFRMTAVAVMMGLLIGAVGKLYAYDFSAVCETGQTLYYNIIDVANNYVQIVAPAGNWQSGWSGYAKPRGNIVLPSSVNYSDITYSVTSIGSYAFYHCSGLTGDLTIPNSVTSIGGYAFCDCTGFTGGLTIGNSVMTIGYGAFSGCSGFTNSLGIPNSVTIINDFAFDGCSGFTGSLTIGNSVTSIGCGSFADCQGFTGTLIIPNSIIIINQAAFRGCIGFTGSLTIPNSVTLVGGNAFQDCCGFVSVTIPSSVTSIGFGVFYGCSGLVSAAIPNSVTSIDGNAFYGCSGLTSITIPNSVTSIESHAFYGCSGLTSITIPNSVTSIGDGAFSACSGLEQIVVESGNTVYDSRGNCNAIIKTNTNNLISGCKNTIIPNSVSSIGNSAFSGCSGLTSIAIPNSVNTIDAFAFSDCIGLTGNLTIPNSVSIIGAFAFVRCSSLSSVTIGSSVIDIGSTPFYDDSNLDTINVLATIVPTLHNTHVFNGTTTDLIIYVPYESLSEYQEAQYWCNYASQMQPLAYKSISGYGTGNGGWAFIASPLTTQSLAPTAAGIENMITETTYDLYRFNQSVELEWQNYKAHTNDFTIANGQGYLYANQEDVNLIFKGTFNEGTSKEGGLTYDGTAQFAGWNLVGNPFPYSATVSRSYYVMNEEGTGLEPTPLSAGNTIAACTGVMVKADGANESVTFAKPTRQNVVNNGLLHIAVANEDKAIVSFNQGDELAKYVFNKDKAQLYIPQGGKDYAVAFSDRQSAVPLNFKAAKDGEYTISIHPQNLELDYLHLIDNLTGNDIDLLQTPDYTFSVKTTDYASRFRLVFSVCGDADGDMDAPFAFVSNGEIILTGVGADTDDVSLQVVDMQGRVLIYRDTWPASSISTNGMASGVYILRLINGDEVKTQKIVVD